MIALTQLTDTQLVSIYQKSQDPAYFGELYRRYYTKVYYYCLGKVKDRDDAYDITANTFVKLTKKILGLKNPELFIAWLFKVANNACMDCLKKRGKTVRVEESSFNNLVQDDQGVEKMIMKEAQLNRLDEVLHELDFETKMLIVNKYFNGKSVKDLEKELGLSTSAVKMRLARGREKIASLFLAKQGGEA